VTPFRNRPSHHAASDPQAHCRKDADGRLLIHVSDLSAHFRHVECRSINMGDGLMWSRFQAVWFCLALAVAAVPASVGCAASRDYDAVRAAVERGEIRPLADLIAIVRNKLPGEITGIEIERRNGIWVYEFRVVDGKGRLSEIHVDARSGEIDRAKER
jgi:peptidase YpeB-like protein